jgi:hypothetical protein
MRGYGLMLLGFVEVAASDRVSDRSGRPIGLLAYKLQFGVLIPIALVASGRWRTFDAATARRASRIAQA